MSDQLAFQVLGPWQAQLGTTPLPVPAGRLRSLLVSLVLADGEPLSIETLAEQVWPQGQPAKVRATLHTYVARLRHLVGHERLVSGPGGYRLIASADLHQFQALLAEALQQAESGETSGESELELLRAALALWRGRPFTEVSSTWLDQEVIPQLTDQWLTATERRIELELAAAGDAVGDELLDELTDLASEHPTREPVAAHLITVLHRTCQRAEALRAFRRIRDTLRAELGVPPGAELLALQRAVLLEGTLRTPRSHSSNAAPADFHPPYSASPAGTTNWPHWTL